MYRGIFIFVLAAASASARTVPGSPLQEPPTDPVVDRCMNESGINKDLFDPRKHNMTDSDLVDTKTGCYTSCIWKAGGMLNEDGTLNAEKSTANLPSNLADREGVVQAFTECSQHKGGNDCETASKVIFCLHHKEAFRNMRPKGASPRN